MYAAQRACAPCATPGAACSSMQQLGAALGRAVPRCATAASLAPRAAAPRALLRVAAVAEGEVASADPPGEPTRAPLRRAPPPPRKSLVGDARAAASAALPGDAGASPAVPPAPTAAAHDEYSASAAPPQSVAAMFDRHYSAPRPMPPSPSLPEHASLLCTRALEAGQTWADSQARADLMEEGKKSVLAALTEHQMSLGLSKAAAETKALCMPEYTDHVLRMTEARHKALSARITYDALKKEVDLVRTYEASRRAETQLM